MPLFSSFSQHTTQANTPLANRLTARLLPLSFAVSFALALAMGTAALPAAAAAADTSSSTATSTAGSASGSAASSKPTDINPLLQGLNPSDVPLQVERFLDADRNAEALALADAGLAQNNSNLKLRFMRTVALERLNRMDEAIAELRRMVGDFPEVPEPYNNLAVILAQRGSLDEAEALLKKVLSISPDFAIARKNLGDVYLTRALENYEVAAKGIQHNKELTRRLAVLEGWFGKENPEAKTDATSTEMKATGKAADDAKASDNQAKKADKAEKTEGENDSLSFTSEFDSATPHTTVRH